jgi:selenocysteine-specific elongation factor
VEHLVIGTAGHVDHGKTSLVHRLTGVMTDRLPEEQRRGITIELGFAPWRLSDDVLISVIDAPGHRRLVHHMIAGAAGIDLVLLVVAADEGVMPQTREHMAACRLLGVRRAVVAITKVDRVDDDLAELAAAEALELLEAHGIVAEAVLCSAKTGTGIAELTSAVLRAVGVADAKRERQQRVRLSVDRVFTVHGSGTVVTGTLVEGELKTGVPLRVLGATRELSASARGLHVHGENRARAAAPTRLAINLGGVSVQDLERGDVITDDPHAVPTRMLDVWMQALEPVKRGSDASLFIGTSRTTARIQPVDMTDVLVEGGLARLRLTAPIVALGGDRFVLRGARVDGPAGAVIGGGLVLDAHPAPTIRAGKRAAVLDAIHRGDADAAVLLLAAERSPRPLAAAELESRFSLTGPALAKAAARLSQEGKLVALADGWADLGALATLRAHALAAVAEHHKSAPLDPGMRRETLRAALAELAGPRMAATVLEELTHAGGELVAVDDIVRLPSFGGAEAGSSAAAALEQARALLREAALQGVTENALKEALGAAAPRTPGADVKLVRAVTAKLSRENEALQTGGLWFDARVVAELQAKIVAHLAAQGRLTIQDFKAMTDLGRKQAIPLLEHFDRLKITKRDGSDRVKG